ncbi:MAG: hypothetical protein AB7E21_15305 [Pseudodonghicola sp.]
MSDLAPIPSAPIARPRAAARPERRQARAGMALLSPALFLMLAILILPVAVAAVLSFTDYTLGRPGLTWVGLENYADLVTRSKSLVLSNYLKFKEKNRPFWPVQVLCRKICGIVEQTHAQCAF